MKTIIFFAVNFFALAILFQFSVIAQTTRPTPLTGKPTFPVTTQTASGKQENRTQKSDPLKVELAGALLSIKEVKQPADQPNIKILIENLGGQTNKPGQDAHLLISLMTPDKNPIKSPISEVGIKNIFFWVTGKPEPHGDGSVWGMTSKTTTPLTQQQIDAMPASTKIPQAFERKTLIPPIAPGQSVWINVDFRLPDPGTYVVPLVGGIGSVPIPTMLYIPAYTDATFIKECDNLKNFFATPMTIKMKMEQKKSPGVSGARTYYESQLSPSYFKFMDIPLGKYDGKCK